MKLKFIATAFLALALATAPLSSAHARTSNLGKALLAGGIAIGLVAQILPELVGPHYTYHSARSEYSYQPAPQIVYQRAPVYYAAPAYYPTPVYYYAPAPQPVLVSNGYGYN